MRLLALLSAILTAGTTSAGQGDCDIPDRSKAAAAVRQLNHEYIEAARTGDKEWYREHMAEDAVIILGDGRRLTKPAFLALFDDPKEFESLSLRSGTIRVFGPTVQVDADAPWELTDGSKGVSRYIDTYAWIDGRWQVISAQITLLPDKD